MSWIFVWKSIAYASVWRTFDYYFHAQFYIVSNLMWYRNNVRMTLLQKPNLLQKPDIIWCILKSLKHFKNCTKMYLYYVYNYNGRLWTTPYNNVWAIMMLFLAYNVNIDQSKSVWYVIEQYGERGKRNIGTSIGDGPPTMMHS